MTAALDFSTPHLIRNEREYDVVVAELRRLLDRNPKEGSRAEERIEFLAVLVGEFDRKHHRLPGGAVTPQQVVTFMLGQRGMSRLAESPWSARGHSYCTGCRTGRRDWSMP